MRRFLYIIFIFFLLSFTNISVKSQNISTLPIDPRITQGNLPNGLHYYIIKNNTTKGQANFTLVQKTGDSAPDDAYNSMNSFLQELGTRGTKNFPDDNFYKYLISLGINPVDNFDFSSDLHNSYYRISQVPINKSNNIVDSTLLLLYNLTYDINFDVTTINNAKKYIKYKILLNQTPQKRIFYNLGNKIFSNSKTYFKITDDSLINHIDTYNLESLKKYYSTWFRPDLEALIIAGDVEPTSIEQKIKSLYQTISSADYKPAFMPEKINTTNLTHYAALSDREIKNTHIGLDIAQNPLPATLKKTAAAYLTDYMNSLTCFLIESHIRKATYGKLPLESLKVNYNYFFNLLTLEGLNIDIEIAPEYGEEAMSLLCKQIAFISNHGFSYEEYSTARDKYIFDMKYKYDNRDNLTNKEFSDRCMENFINNRDLSSLELKTEYLTKISKTISIDNFNDYVKSLLGNQSNRVITYCLPDLYRNHNISDKSLTDRVRNICEQAISDTSYHFNNSIHSDSLNVVVNPGSITSSSIENTTKAQVWSLSNGATAIFKANKSEASKIYIEAIVKGNYPQGIISSDIQALYPDEPFYMSEIRRQKGITIKYASEPYGYKLTGKCYSKDIQTLLQMIYLKFTHDPLPANLSNYTFLISGDINNNNLEHYVCSYLASLPARKSNYQEAEKRIDNTMNGSINEDYQDMEVPHYKYRINISREIEFDFKNRLINKMALTAFRKSLQNELHNVNFPANVSFASDVYPNNSMSLNIDFVLSEENYAQLDEIKKLIINAAIKGISSAETQAIKNQYLNEFNIAQNSDISFWCKILEYKYIWNQDYFTGYEKIVKSVNERILDAKLLNFVETGKVTCEIQKPSANYNNIPKDIDNNESEKDLFNF
ncbi:MAG: insulinase family protein [Bacteroidales bacterium]